MADQALEAQRSSTVLPDILTNAGGWCKLPGGGYRGLSYVFFGMSSVSTDDGAGLP